MSRQIGLDLALTTLSKAKFITPTESGFFKLGPNGVTVHKHLISKLLQGQTAFDPRKSRLQKAAFDQTLTLNTAKAAAFDFRVCQEEGVSVIGEEPTVNSLTVLKDAGTSEKWTFSFHDFLRTRRTFWKALTFDPAALQVTEKNARSKTPSASIEASPQKNFDLPNTLQLESIKMLDEDEIREFSDANELKVVMSRSKAMSGTLALLMDSVRGRLFASKSAPPRLALAKDVVPHQVAVCEIHGNGDEIDPDLSDFRRYLTSLLEAETGVKVWDGVQTGDEYFNEYDACDSHGIPYLVIVTPQSLKDGIVNIRDRETTWFEQIHAAHLTQRFKHCFSALTPMPAPLAEKQTRTGTV